MRSKLLYPLLLAGVLMSSSCAGEEKAKSVVPAGSDTSIVDPDSAADMEATAQDDAQANATKRTYRVVFLGDSITAGLGVDEEQAFPALIRERINAEDYPFEVVAAGVSGETSSGGLSGIDWILRNPVDVLVIELGGNDALRGVDLNVTRANLTGIIERTRTAYPDCQIVLSGMMVPPNLGHEYTTAFRDMYPEIASRLSVTLIPFILEGVGGVPEHMQADGIHPSVSGHAIVGRTVWHYLEPVLRTVMDAVENA